MTRKPLPSASARTAPEAPSKEPRAPRPLSREAAAHALAELAALVAGMSPREIERLLAARGDLETEGAIRTLRVVAAPRVGEERARRAREGLPAVETLVLRRRP